MSAIERLFSELAAMYGSSFAAQWRDVPPDAVKRTWADGLSGMGMTWHDVQRGLTNLRQSGKVFPPTLPEFIGACRHVVNEDTAFTIFALAQQCAYRRQMPMVKPTREAWPNAAAYWAAVDIGFADLIASNWGMLKNRWIAAYSARLLQTELPPIPEPALALPSPGRGRTNKDKARQHLAELLAGLKGQVTA